MTTLPVAAPEAPELMPRRRLIAVAVRDADQDAAALTWTAYDANAGWDAVHVVHAYVPSRLDEVGVRDDKRRAADRIAQRAAQQLRAVQPGLRVHASSVAGLPTDVLIEFAAAVDVLVVGTGAPGQAIISRRVVPEHARAAVVCVPPGYRPSADGRPVTVVVGDVGLSDGAMRFAAGYAHRHGVTLQVSCGRPPHRAEQTGTAWLAYEQEQLDIQLAGWREDHPYVPIIARLEYGNDRWPRLAAHSALLVITADQLSTNQWACDPPQPHCPVAVVSD